MAPLWGWLLGLAGFTACSWLLFSRTRFAIYLYLFFAASLLIQLSNTTRTNFLSLTFPRRTVRRIRMAENGLLMLPFLLFLLLKHYALVALGMIPVTLLMAFTDHSLRMNTTIPTPFGKQPFEFLTGFRQSLLFILGAYILMGIGIFVGNVNLGLFAAGANLLIILSFYSRPEPLFYVWNMACTPAGFLRNKIKTALLHTTILIILPLTAFLLAFPEKWWAIIGMQLLGYLYVVQILLVKYVAYPDEISLVQVLLFAGSILFPPLLLGLIPYYYSRSVNRLTLYLHD